MKIKRTIRLAVVLMALPVVQAIAQIHKDSIGQYVPMMKLQGEQLTNDNRLLRYVTLGGYREGIAPTNANSLLSFKRINNSGNGTSMIIMANVSLVEMLCHSKINPERVELEVSDPVKYMYRPEYGDKEAWTRKYAMCFEYLMPSSMVGRQQGTKIRSPFVWDLALRDMLGVTVRRDKKISSAAHRYGLEPGEPDQEVEIFIITEINRRK